MQLHKILYGISFCTGITGAAGMTGAIEWGTGYITSAALLLISVASGIWSAYEDGTWKRGREREEWRDHHVE